MGKVTALKMDVVTKKSGHQMTGMAVSVCITPAAPSPVPIPYPTMGTVAEGITDPCMRTKIGGAIVMTVGSCMSKCHGNEPGTLKEVVSLNTAGPCFPALGAPIVIMELGMAGITGSIGQMNKSITVGASGSASGAGGGAGGGGGGGGGGSGPGGQGTQGPGGGGGDGGGDNEGAAPPEPPAPQNADGQASAGHPIDVITGDLYTSRVVDFSLPGPLWVRWGRSYRVAGAATRCGMGWGWSHDLAWRGVRRGERLTLTDNEGSDREVIIPADGERVALGFGRSLSGVGADLVLELGDGLERVLRPVDKQGKRYVLSELRNRHGQSATVEWDDREVVGIVDSVGRRAELRVEGPHKSWFVLVRDEEGREHEWRAVTYTLDDCGDLVSVIDAGGAEYQFAYDDEHRLISESRPDGLVYHFVHRFVMGRWRCVESWGELPEKNVLAEIYGGQDHPPAKGLHHVRFEYGPEPRTTRLIDALGNVHRYWGNEKGLVERYVDPRGHAKKLTFDRNGRALGMEDGAGRRTRISYDNRGRMVTYRKPDGSQATMRYDDGENCTQIITPGGGWRNRFEGSRVAERTAPDGRTFLYGYDGHGLPNAVEHPDGSKETVEYDAHGNACRVTSRQGLTYTYAYDLLGCPIRLEQPNGATYELEYDSRLDVVGVEGPEGRTEHEVDGMRRIVATRHPDGNTSEYHYVGPCLVERKYPDGRRFRMGYDALGRLLYIENPDGERYQLWYDEVGNRVAERNFAGHLRRHAFNGANFPYSTMLPDESSVTTSGSADGSTLTYEHSGGSREVLKYDAQGFLVRAENANAEVEYERDARGRPVRETQRTGAWSFTIHREYTAGGERARTRFSTGWQIEHERPPGQPPQRVVIRQGESDEELEELQAITFERDALQNEVRRVDPATGLAIETDRDLLGRPTAIRVVGADGDVVRERRYRWSKQGPPDRVEDSARGTRTIELDPMGRPVRASGLGARESFSYTAMGVPVPEDKPCSHGAGGRPQQIDGVTLAWDRRGRLEKRTADDPKESWTYRYDHCDRLVEAVRGDGRRVTFLYDALGRRLAETCEGVTTFFGWDGNEPVEEQTSDGKRVRRLFAPDRFTLLAEGRSDAPFDLVASDAAATPWFQIAADGETSEVELDTWGKALRTVGTPTDLRFAGQRYDARTGLSYQRHRYYAPELATFLTPDPLPFDDSLADVVFVPNPGLWIDPLGLWTAIIQAQSRENGFNRAVGLTGDAVVPATNDHAAANPGSRVISYEDIDNGTASLAGADRVIVITHGAPGSVCWGKDRPIIGASGINGQQLGEKLKGAGFNGQGATVDVLSCNAGTDPVFGQSVIDGVHESTGATAYGARADNRFLGYFGGALGIPSSGTTSTALVTPPGGGTPVAYEVVDRGGIARAGPPTSEPAWVERQR